MKKILTFIITAFVISSPIFAMELNDIKQSKDQSYRVGSTDYPEKEFRVKEIADEKKAITTKTIEQAKNITYADLSLKNISKEISQDLELDENLILEHIKTLWSGAAMKSETIKFAMYKLSNPEDDKPNQSIIKKIIKPVASLSSIASAGVGSPVAATTAIMGSTFLNSLSVDDKDLNYKFSKVTDADMIILVRKIDDLQQNLTNKYFDYVKAKKNLDMNNEILAKRKIQYEKAKKSSNEKMLITDAYYRSALDRQKRAQSEFLSKRSELEQIVGQEAFLEFELLFP